MSKELKQLKKSYLLMSKEDIFAYIRQCRSKIDLKEDIKKTKEFAQVLFEIMDSFSENGDVNSERIILNQLVEIAWWSKQFSELVSILSQAIYKLLIDSQRVRDSKRTELFTDFIDIIVRIPENKIIYDAISRASIELIRWGKDDEILEILAIVKKRTIKYPLVNALHLLSAKTYMNALFYLDDQNCDIINKLYYEFVCFSINEPESEITQECNGSRLLLGEDIDDIYQEGVINAILNMARINSRLETPCEDCISYIRNIILESEKLLRKNESEFYKDVYRLSVTLDQFKLWERLVDIPVIADLQTERDRNLQYQMAEGKLLAIQKMMRIEEYDALKIGRRGLLLKYNINDIDDLGTIASDLESSIQNNTPFTIVEEIDAIIETNNEVKEHLRETGQIPADRKTIDEIQDETTRSDDLTIPATKEEKVIEQLEFLKELELQDKRFVINQLMHTKALIFSVGMYGLNSEILKITREEITEHILNMSEKKLVVELVNPLVRATTLRAARLDSESTIFLLKTLNNKGLKFLSKHYKQYNFIDNIIRLVSFLARRGETVKLERLKREIDTANRLCLDDTQMCAKFARAINEGILTFSATSFARKSELLDILKTLGKRHSYNVDTQIKIAEGYAFFILTSRFDDYKNITKIADELSAFSKEYSNNQKIKEKAALGLLWAQLILRNTNHKMKEAHYKKEIAIICANHSENVYLQKIKHLSEM